MNTDIRLQTSFLTHRKRKKLESRLGKAAVLSLVDLWMSVAINKPKGILIGMDCEDIAMDANWEGDAKLFCDTLVELRFMDLKNGVYSIHDWKEHQSYAFHAEERTELARKAALIRWKNKEKKVEGNWVGNAEGMPDAMPNDAEGMRTNAEGNAPAPAPAPSPSPSPVPSPSPSLNDTTTTIVDSETESSSLSHNGDQNDTKNRGNDAAPGNGPQDQNDEPPIVREPSCEGTGNEGEQGDRINLDIANKSETTNGLSGNGEQGDEGFNGKDNGNKFNIDQKDSHGDHDNGGGDNNGGGGVDKNNETKKEKKYSVTKSFTIQNAREMRLPWWSEQEWEDLIDLRRKKKTAQTKRAYNQLIKEFELARKRGYTAEEIINAMSFGKGWAGFKLEWMKDPPENRNGTGIKRQTKEEMRRELKEKYGNPLLQETSSGEHKANSPTGNIEGGYGTAGETLQRLFGKTI